MEGKGWVFDTLGEMKDLMAVQPAIRGWMESALFGY